MRPPEVGAWERIFRQQLHDYKADPPTDALDRIFAAVDNIPPPPGFYWRSRLLSGVVGLLLLGLAGYFTWQLENKVIGSGYISSQTAKKPTQQQASQQRTTNQHSFDKTPTSAHSPVPITQPLSSRHLVDLVERSLPHTSTELAKKSAIVPGQLPTSDMEGFLTVAPTIPTRSIHRHQTDSQPIAQVGTDNVKVAQTPPSTLQAPTEQVANPAVTSILLTSLLANEASPAPMPLTEAVVMATKATSLAARPWRLASVQLTLPAVPVIKAPVSEAIATLPTIERVKRTPSYFLSVAPISSYREIEPVANDKIAITNIRSPGALSPGRIGWRYQAGIDVPVTERLSLRTGIVYTQFRQWVRYTVQNTVPDTVYTTVLSDNSVKLTPVFAQQQLGETNVWHHVGISIEGVYRLMDGRVWSHFVSLGSSVGRFLSPDQTISGFVQAGYSLERSLTNRVRLRITPSVQYGWRQRYDNSDHLLITPYSYGVAFALQFR